jgi:hypothetical protein
MVLVPIFQFTTPDTISVEDALIETFCLSTVCLGDLVHKRISNQAAPDSLFNSTTYY